MKTTIRHGPESCRSDPPQFKIETAEDYALVKRRIDALMVQDGSSYRELMALKDAVRLWEMEQRGAEQGCRPDGM
jgi:hypothetical protein